MKYKNILVVGTSHIAPQSIQEVRDVILQVRPAVVALELDARRLYGLLHRQESRVSFRDIRRFGVQGFLFSVIGAYVEKKLGERVGVKPGDEMRAAFLAAREVGARVALIDQNIEVTLQRVSAAFGWREKLHLVKDVIDAFVFRKDEFGFDLASVPDPRLVGRLIRKFRKRYPQLYRVLVKERNEFMAKQLHKVRCDFPDEMVVAVLGAGHENDVIRLMRRLDSPRRKPF